MIRHFCLATDKNYLAKAITMIESLNNIYGESAKYYYFCFDSETFELLKRKEFPNIIPISLSEFEDEQLLSIKATRTPAEYFFTCTPSFVLYCLKRFNLQMCTYIDSDLYFFSTPEPLFEEMEKAGKSVMIIEHRFSQKYIHNLHTGKYCVQFMPFKNNEEGLKILNWWRNACIDWCYHKAVDGKWGDQGYLNDWPTRFTGVHELLHLGGGVAPWNMDNYVLFKENNKLFVTETLNVNKQKFILIFYHFQGVRFIFNWLFSIGYSIRKDIYRNIYKLYINELWKTAKRIKLLNNNLDPLGINNNFGLKQWSKILYRLIFRDVYIKLL